MAGAISPFPMRMQQESNEQTNASFTKEKIVSFCLVVPTRLLLQSVDTDHLLCTRHRTDCQTAWQELACQLRGSHMMHHSACHQSNHIRDSSSLCGTDPRPDLLHDPDPCHSPPGLVCEGHQPHLLSTQGGAQQMFSTHTTKVAQSKCLQGSPHLGCAQSGANHQQQLLTHDGGRAHSNTQKAWSAERQNW